MNKIVLGDCIEVMKTIEDNSIDMVLCDLPYGVTQNEWDSVIPFEQLWESYKRICKKNAAIVLFGTQPFTTIMIGSNIKNFKHEYVWKKTKATGFFNAKHAPMKEHENIIVFSFSTAKYNAQKTKGLPYDRTIGRKKKDQFGTSWGNIIRKEGFENKSVDGSRYPRSILEFGSENNGSNVNPTLHPTQKPVDLLRFLVRTYTNEGDVVLDNTCGSGSTAVACVIEKRQYYMIEQNEVYFEIAKKRIEEEEAQILMF